MINYQNRPLKTKILIGFVLVLSIAIVLGFMAIVSMYSVKRTANTMVDKYVPEVAVANNVERFSLLTMYEMRGYAFTDNDSFFQKGQAHLTEIKAHLKEAQKLAEDQNLPKLRAASSAAESKVLEYEKLAGETKEKTDELTSIRAEAEKAAAVYMEACDTYTEKKERELVSTKNVELFKEIKIVAEIKDTGNLIKTGTYRSIAERNPKLFTETQGKFSTVYRLLDSLVAIAPSGASEDMQLIEKCRVAARSYDECMTRFLKDWLAREDLGQQRSKVADEVLALAQEASKLGMENVDKGAKSATTTLSAASIVLILGQLIGVGIGLVLSFFMGGAISGSINTIVQTLSAGAAQTESAAGQISAAGQQLAAGATEQAASLEQTSSSLEELSSMTKHNAENAQNAKNLAQETKEAADAGSIDMEKMTVAIQDIKDSSENITKIIKTIDEIAFQTNLLALNAAVEAARAGDAGMGFAVVADEVRNLAQRSATAAKETTEKIEAALVKSNNGVTICAKVSEEFKAIVKKATRVDELVAEIAASSVEESAGISQINKAVSEMDKVTQSNAASAEESASAAEEMTAQAREVKCSVEELNRLVSGAGNAGANSPYSQSNAERVQVAPRRSTPVKHAAAAPEKWNRKSIPMESHTDYKELVCSLAEACPCGTEKAGCSLSYVRKLPASERQEAVSQMSESQQKEIYQKHEQCMSIRTRSMAN